MYLLIHSGSGERRRCKLRSLNGSGRKKQRRFDVATNEERRTTPANPSNPVLPGASGRRDKGHAANEIDGHQVKKDESRSDGAENSSQVVKRRATSRRTFPTVETPPPPPEPEGPRPPASRPYPPDSRFCLNSTFSALWTYSMAP